MPRALFCLLALAACTHAAPYAPVERGEVALAMGDSDDAADAYRDALAFRPDDPRALLGMARTELTRGQAIVLPADIVRSERCAGRGGGAEVSIVFSRDAETRARLGSVLARLSHGPPPQPKSSC